MAEIGFRRSRLLAPAMFGFPTPPFSCRFFRFLRLFVPPSGLVAQTLAREWARPDPFPVPKNLRGT
jgi:hypothetical protein